VPGYCLCVDHYCTDAESAKGVVFYVSDQIRQEIQKLKHGSIYLIGTDTNLMRPIKARKS